MFTNLKIQMNLKKRLLPYSVIRWPTRDTLSPCKSIAAPCKIGCSIQTYEASPYKN